MSPQEKVHKSILKQRRKQGDNAEHEDSPQPQQEQTGGNVHFAEQVVSVVWEVKMTHYQTPANPCSCQLLTKSKRVFTAVEIEEILEKTEKRREEKKAAQIIDRPFWQDLILCGQICVYQQHSPLISCFQFQRWRYRWCELRVNYLVLYYDRCHTSTPALVLSLQSSSVVITRNQLKKKNDCNNFVFEIHHSNKEEVVKLSCETRKSMYDWLWAIRSSANLAPDNSCFLSVKKTDLCKVNQDSEMIIERELSSSGPIIDYQTLPYSFSDREKEVYFPSLNNTSVFTNSDEVKLYLILIPSSADPLVKQNNISNANEIAVGKCLVEMFQKIKKQTNNQSAKFQLKINYGNGDCISKKTALIIEDLIQAEFENINKGPCRFISDQNVVDSTQPYLLQPVKGGFFHKKENGTRIDEGHLGSDMDYTLSRLKRAWRHHANLSCLPKTTPSKISTSSKERSDEYISVNILVGDVTILNALMDLALNKGEAKMANTDKQKINVSETHISENCSISSIFIRKNGTIFVEKLNSILHLKDEPIS